MKWNWNGRRRERRINELKERAISSERSKRESVRRFDWSSTGANRTGTNGVKLWLHKTGSFHSYTHPSSPDRSLVAR